MLNHTNCVLHMKPFELS